jgi:hypothetical protein
MIILAIPCNTSRPVVNSVGKKFARVAKRPISGIVAPCGAGGGPSWPPLQKHPCTADGEIIA